jgi:GNAT superfamily N-acetyltransferase
VSGALTVRAPVLEEAPRLSAIAQAAKAHWGYPAEWLELWRGELTFDAATLEREWIRVAESEGRVVALVALAEEGGELELSHLWVDPVAMGMGIGRTLFEAAVAEARRRGARRLRIVADPHAETFYEHLGARRAGSVPSRPAGRTLPLMLFEP